MTSPLIFLTSMAGIIDWIKKTFSAGTGTRLSPEELQAAFRTRYVNFRALLTANNNALEAMAEMEQALQSGQTFSMAFVRSRSTRVLVNVYKMIRHMIEMSDGRYHQLEPLYEKISGQVDGVINKMPRVHSGKWIVPLSAINRDMADQVGEKMANLGEVAGLAGVETPLGFAITVSASSHFLTANKLQPKIRRIMQMLDRDNLAEVYEASATIQQLITNSTLPTDLEEKIYAAYAELEKETQPGVMVAMRSSATGEDLAGASFAGQYHTELNVDKEFLGHTYKEIVASKYTSRALLYRLQRGYRNRDIDMCVGCLPMVDAVVSGIIYTRDPADPSSDWVSLDVVRGTAQKVVEGTSSTDLFHVSRQSPHRILLHTIANNNSFDSASPYLDILTKKQAKDITEIALILENHFGSPQDIEWSIDKQGRIIILQSRPMVAFVAARDHDKSNVRPEAEVSCLLRGTVTASSGVACGPVFTVRSSLDMLQFPKGAILVVEHPLPEWAPLLTKATALIGETGSVAGHLATVSREFGIPAIFGVDDALKKLKNNEIITVDADNRLIHSGKREDLLARSALQPDLMANSPIQLLLRDLLQYISPLNLTDPNSPFFKSTYCETLHDITRFCHEKAVVEMFSFGKKKHFDEHAAKRLVRDVALDWWVVDLSDGFREGVNIKDKTIHVDDIVSAPMNAILAGIDAFPWAGPPAVCVKGLGSILFRSTMQPGLDPAVATPLTAKNYFLISKNYCNLSVRLGYHFAMIEAFLSDLLTESYVAFTFKGGAADAERRIGRIELISEILQQFDFRIEQ
ncbi:MAG: PEP/pyruvate-binding domain-containing protein, partial [Thermodesulfobacteriota bacterium]|nr:PEP/pyruvate-binding domain-containing protein [Thermodesulfobacteriota bacterium]